VRGTVPTGETPQRRKGSKEKPRPHGFFIGGAAELLSAPSIGESASENGHHDTARDDAKGR
jgi:hypothetical protein